MIYQPTIAIGLILGTLLPSFAGTPEVTPQPQVSPAPLPSSISYDYVEASYSHAWLDDTPFDLFNQQDGYAIGLNKSIGQGMFLFASFDQYFASESGQINAFGFDVDASGDTNTLGAVLGLGFHVPVTKNIDWVIQAGGTYSRLEVDVEGSINGNRFEVDDVLSGDGFGVQASTGFRIACTSWLELNLFYQYGWNEMDVEILGEDVGSADSDVHAGKAAIIFRNVGVQSLDLVLSGLVAESFRSANAGLRFNF
jgi:hypothetical protein